MIVIYNPRYIHRNICEYLISLFTYMVCFCFFLHLSSLVVSTPSFKYMFITYDVFIEFFRFFRGFGASSHIQISKQRYNTNTLRHNGDLHIQNENENTYT